MSLRQFPRRSSARSSPRLVSGWREPRRSASSAASAGTASSRRPARRGSPGVLPCERGRGEKREHGEHPASGAASCPVLLPCERGEQPASSTASSPASGKQREHGEHPTTSAASSPSSFLQSGAASSSASGAWRQCELLHSPWWSCARWPAPGGRARCSDAVTSTLNARLKNLTDAFAWQMRPELGYCICPLKNLTVRMPSDLSLLCVCLSWLFDE